MPIKKKNIVTIGGGTGQFTLLSGLRDIEHFNVTAVVSMMDSGGSTGRLRDEFGVLPPGDALKCILALSSNRDFARNIFLKRFVNDRRLKGHTAGNMLLTMLSQYTGSFPSGINALAEILEVKGTILPVTTDRATLVAELSDGRRIFGESAIDLPKDAYRESIKDVFLVPHHGDSISVFPPVIEAIYEADFIFIGPGDLFTSIIPNFIVPGVKEALQKTKAPLIYILNIMTKLGETTKFTGGDFLHKIEENIKRQLDAVIFNNEIPEDGLLKRYQAEMADVVQIDFNSSIWTDCTIHQGPMLNTSGGIIRHDSNKLANIIESVIEKR
jgi:uncharacterized cofD-like protein